MRLWVKGTGSALGEALVTNDELSKYMETSDEWIRERTGIEARHLSLGESTEELASKAALEAINNSGVSPEDIDIVIVATCSSELALPCVACQVQSSIGAVNAVSFDLNAACAGFLFALNTVYTYFKSGIYKKALVVGAEVLSKMVDWEDRTTAILFGDGAGAVVCEAVKEEEDNFCFVQRADGSKGSVLTCTNRNIENIKAAADFGKKKIEMDGREIFKFAVKTVPECIEELLEKEGISKESIDYYFLHQANKRIIGSIAKGLKEPLEKFPTNVEKVGNMSSAAIPVLLHEYNKKGALKRGDRLVFSGFGAGLTYGASFLEW